MEAALFFANSDRVRDRINALITGDTRIVVLDAESSPDIDVTAANMLTELAAALARDGIQLRIARDIGQFREVIRSAASDAFREHVYRSVDEALRAPRAGDGQM